MHFRFPVLSTMSWFALSPWSLSLSLSSWRSSSTSSFFIISDAMASATHPESNASIRTSAGTPPTTFRCFTPEDAAATEALASPEDAAATEALASPEAAAATAASRAYVPPTLAAGQCFGGQMWPMSLSVNLPPFFSRSASRASVNSCIEKLGTALVTASNRTDWANYCKLPPLWITGEEYRLIRPTRTGWEDWK